MKQQGYQSLKTELLYLLEALLSPSMTEGAETAERIAPWMFSCNVTLRACILSIILPTTKWIYFNISGNICLPKNEWSPTNLPFSILTCVVLLLLNQRKQNPLYQFPLSQILYATLKGGDYPLFKKKVVALWKQRVQNKTDIYLYNRSLYLP